jgi:hypothetical protein
MQRMRVAASDERLDAEGVRIPAGEAHAWTPGHNQTVCGVPLFRARLQVFPHVPWEFRDTDIVAARDAVRHICRRCRAAVRSRPKRGQHRNWSRTTPRP